jgi:hypothetical protein
MKMMMLLLLLLRQNAQSQETIQCSFAGRMHPTTSRCICRAPWVGARCSELPTPPHRRTAATYAAALGGVGRRPWVVAQCTPPGSTDTSDCTSGLSAALASPPGSTVFVPRITNPSDLGPSSFGTAVGNVGSTPWNVRGVDFGGSNLRVVFEAGVVVQAKRNATYLFACTTISDLAVMHGLTNVSVAGYGATLRMWRELYVSQCKHSEFRMALAIQRSRGIQIAGLTISHAGGDGLIVMGDGKPGPGVDATVGLTLRDMILDHNYRQGISVISVVDMLVVNTTLSNTNGTSPAHGVDFEPDTSKQLLQNITFRNCSSLNNQGAGFGADFAGLTGCGGSWASGCPAVTIRIEDCIVSNNHVGYALTTAYPHLPGAIEIVRGETHNTASHGIAIYGKAASAFSIRFTDHWLSNVSSAGLSCETVDQKKLCPAGLKPINGPVALFLRDGTPAAEGNISFDGLRVADTAARPWLQVIGDSEGWNTVKLNNISVQNPAGCTVDLSHTFGTHPLAGRVPVTGLGGVTCNAEATKKQRGLKTDDAAASDSSVKFEAPVLVGSSNNSSTHFWFSESCSVMRFHLKTDDVPKTDGGKRPFELFSQHLPQSLQARHPHLARTNLRDMVIARRASEGHPGAGFPNCTAALAYEVATTGRLSVATFGALGDGDSDDAPAVRRAITMSVACGSVDVWFPPGDFCLNSTIVITASFDGLALVGSSGVASISPVTHRRTGHGSEVMFTHEPSVIIEGPRDGPAFLVNDTLGVYMSGLSIKGGSAAVVVVNSAGLKFDNVGFAAQLNSDGVNTSAPGANIVPNSTNAALVVENCFWLWMSDCAFNFMTCRTHGCGQRPSLLLRSRKLPYPTLVNDVYLLSIRDSVFTSGGVQYQALDECDGCGAGFWEFTDIQMENTAGPLLDIQSDPRVVYFPGVSQITISGFMDADPLPATYADLQGVTSIVQLNCTQSMCVLDGLSITSSQSNGAGFNGFHLGHAVRVFAGRIRSVMILDGSYVGAIDIVDAHGTPFGSWVSKSGGGFIFLGTDAASTDAAILAGQTSANDFPGIAAPQNRSSSHALLFGLSGERGGRLAVEADGSMRWGNGGVEDPIPFDTSFQRPISAAVKLDPPKLQPREAASFVLTKVGDCSSEHGVLHHGCPSTDDVVVATHSSLGSSAIMLSAHVQDRSGSVRVTLLNTGKNVVDMPAGRLHVTVLKFSGNDTDVEIRRVKTDDSVQPPRPHLHGIFLDLMKKYFRRDTLSRLKTDDHEVTCVDGADSTVELAAAFNNSDTSVTLSSGRTCISEPQTISGVQNLTVTLGQGAELQAKRDSIAFGILLDIEGASDITLQGATTTVNKNELSAEDPYNLTTADLARPTLRMWRNDYLIRSKYHYSEWRHCIQIHGCSRVTLYNLRLTGSGGTCANPCY